MDRLLSAAILAAMFLIAGCDSTDPAGTIVKPNGHTPSANTKAALPASTSSSEDAEETYPRFTWKRTHLSSGSKGTATVQAASFDEIEGQVRRLDWSSEGSDLPSVLVEIDSNHSLAIEMAATREADGRPIVATWKRAGETQGATTAILTRTSRPLKDLDHALTLLRAYFAGEDLEPLAEWVMP